MNFFYYSKIKNFKYKFQYLLINTLELFNELRFIFNIYILIYYEILITSNSFIKNLSLTYCLFESLSHVPFTLSQS